MQLTNEQYLILLGKKEVEREIMEIEIKRLTQQNSDLREEIRMLREQGGQPIPGPLKEE